MRSISSEKEVDHNLKEVTRIGQKYILEISQFESLTHDLKKTKAPPLCSTLCNGSFLDQERFANERGTYLQSYYKNQKSAALQDPNFRIKLEELTFISKAFPKSVRTIMTDILERPEASTTHPLMLALRLEGVMLSELAGVKSHWAQLQIDSHKLDVLKGLVNSCQTGQTGMTRKQILEECRREFPN